MINQTATAEFSYSEHGRPLVYGGLLLLLICAGLYIASLYEEPILRFLQANEAWLKTQVQENPYLAPTLFVALFALVIGFYIPGGVVLLLMAGAMFPVWEANIYANIGNLLGALIGFGLSRHFFYREVQGRYRQQLKNINPHIRRNGWFYLLLLRIAPVMPSPVVNLLMGVTPIGVLTYTGATLLGRIPMTAIYVQLGAELSEVDKLSDILSAEVAMALLLLCVLIVGGNHLFRRFTERQKQSQ